MTVTIIIPHIANTRHEYFEQAVLSVFSQTYKDIELIVCAENEDFFIKVNRAIDRASGELIHFLHDDDYLNPESVERAVNAISEYDFICGDVINFYQETGQQSLYKAKLVTFEQLKEANSVHVAGMYYKKQALQDIGGWTEGAISDWTVTLELLLNNKKMGICNEVVSYYRKHEQQAGKNNDYKQNRNKYIQAVQEKYANREIILQ
jgi:glycosyltransferase involved in cell wall biosynthesis